MGDINFRAITWHGLLWQQKGNYISSNRQEQHKLIYFFMIVFTIIKMTIFYAYKNLNLALITKRNNAMMSKPKTCWVKKLVSKKEKGKLSSSKFFVPQVIICFSYISCESFVYRHMCPFRGCNVKIKDIIIKLNRYLGSFTSGNLHFLHNI